MLPKKNTTEWDAEVKFYQTSTADQRSKRATELGYSSAGSYETGMNRRGIHLINGITPKIEIPVINIPSISLKKYNPVNHGRTGNPETQCLHLSDHHDDEITISYNHGVYLQRLEHLFHSTVHIAKLHRNMYPINKLEIFVTGDMVHGENPFQGAKVESINHGVKNQIFCSSLPALFEFIMSLKQEYAEVEIWCVPGNHGRYSKEAPSSSNWDLILYEALKLKLEPYKIKVHISESFCQIVDVQGQKFFLFHGHQCKASQGVPYFSLTKKVMSWYVTYGGFDYAVCGHFHKDDFLRINSRCKLFMGGSMVTDDPFAQEIIGTSSIPCQWTWGVHKNKGVTWSYSLIVDDKFFPKEQVLPSAG